MSRRSDEHTHTPPRYLPHVSDEYALIDDTECREVAAELRRAWMPWLQATRNMAASETVSLTVAA